MKLKLHNYPSRFQIRTWFLVLIFLTSLSGIAQNRLYEFEKEKPRSQTGLVTQSTTSKKQLKLASYSSASFTIVSAPQYEDTEYFYAQSITSSLHGINTYNLALVDTLNEVYQLKLYFKGTTKWFYFNGENATTGKMSFTTINKPTSTAVPDYGKFAYARKDKGNGRFYLTSDLEGTRELRYSSEIKFIDSNSSEGDRFYFIKQVSGGKTTDLYLLPPVGDGESKTTKLHAKSSLNSQWISNMNTETFTLFCYPGLQSDIYIGMGVLSTGEIAYVPLTGIFQVREYDAGGNEIYENTPPQDWYTFNSSTGHIQITPSFPKDGVIKVTLSANAHIIGNSYFIGPSARSFYITSSTDRFSSVYGPGVNLNSNGEYEVIWSQKSSINVSGYSNASISDDRTELNLIWTSSKPNPKNGDLLKVNTVKGSYTGSATIFPFSTAHDSFYGTNEQRLKIGGIIHSGKYWEINIIPTLTVNILPYEPGVTQPEGTQAHTHFSEAMWEPQDGGGHVSVEGEGISVPLTAVGMADNVNPNWGDWKAVITPTFEAKGLEDYMQSHGWATEAADRWHESSAIKDSYACHVDGNMLVVEEFRPSCSGTYNLKLTYTPKDCEEGQPAPETRYYPVNPGEWEFDFNVYPDIADLQLGYWNGDEKGNGMFEFSKTDEAANQWTGPGADHAGWKRLNVQPKGGYVDIWWRNHDAPRPAKPMTYSSDDASGKHRAPVDDMELTPEEQGYQKMGPHYIDASNINNLDIMLSKNGAVNPTYATLSLNRDANLQPVGIDAPEISDEEEAAEVWFTLDGRAAAVGADGLPALPGIYVTAKGRKIIRH